MSVHEDGRALVVIPARGGSIGIPRKNLATVAEVPLVVTAIRAAQRAIKAGAVVVSTDDDEIAETAAAEGARVIKRPSGLATSIASSEGVVSHVLRTLESEGSELPLVTLLVQCTSPFIEGSDIDAVVEKLEVEDADSCLTVSETHAFLWEEDDSRTGTSINHDSAARLPRQETRPQYVETGAVYGFKTAGFLRAQSRFFGRTVLAIVDYRRTLEIDEPFDLVLARRWKQALQLDFFRHEMLSRFTAVVCDFDGGPVPNWVLANGDRHETAISVDDDDVAADESHHMRPNVKLLVLSSNQNDEVRKRCEVLGVDYKTGINDKATTVKEWLSEIRSSEDECLYIGDTICDHGCINLVEYSTSSAITIREIAAGLVFEGKNNRGSLDGVLQSLSEPMYRKADDWRTGDISTWAD